MTTRTQILTSPGFADASDVTYKGIPIDCYLSTPGGVSVLDLENHILSNGTRYGVGTLSDAITGAISLTAVYVGDLRFNDGTVAPCQLVITGAGQMIESPEAGYAYASSIDISTWLPTPSTTGTTLMILDADLVSDAPYLGLTLAIDISVTVVKPDASVLFAGQPVTYGSSGGRVSAPLTPTSVLSIPTARYKITPPGGIWYFDVPTNPTGYQGAWNSGTTYHVHDGASYAGPILTPLLTPPDVVLSGGVYYQAVADSLNHVPPNVTYWKAWGGEPIPWHLTDVAVTGATVVNASNIAATGTTPGALIVSPGTVQDVLGNLLYTDKYGNLAVRTVSTTFTATTSDDIILVDTTSGSVSGTVPTAVGQAKPIMIIKLDASAHTVTINPGVGGQTFNGAVSYILSTRDAGALLLSDGANYTIPSYPTADENVVTATTTHTVLPAEDVIEADGTSSAWALNLPPAANRVRPIRVILGPLATSAANIVTITPNGAETINNAATLALTTLYSGVLLNANTLGTGWDAYPFTPASLTNPMTTAGDIIVGGASGVPARLAIGTSTQVLTVTGGVPVWAASGGGGGSISYAWALKTANYTVVLADTNILVDCTSGALTITLPTAVGFTGRVSIKKKDNSAHALSIATTSSQLIDGGAAPITVSLQGVSITLVSDGANWWLE